MSSTVSWSSAAQSVSVSSRRPAQIWATPTGWVMNSSPERRCWSAWRSQAKSKARSTSWRSIGSTVVGLVLLDDREEVAEERALVGGQLARDRVGAGRARAPGGLADPGVAATIAVAQGPAVTGRLALLRARYACALLRRNRMASWCLARQSA